MSADLMQRLESARAEIDVGWSDERAQLVGRQMVRRKRRRATIRAVGLAVTSMVVLFIVGFGARQWLSRSAVPNVAVAPSNANAPAVLKLADGSVVTPLDRDSLVRASSTSANRVVVQVATGGASFDVAPNPSRVFRVEAGRVAVEVLGTSFTVERLADETAKVVVQRGRVRVSWDQQATELSAGEQGIFPRQSSDSALPQPRLLHRRSNRLHQRQRSLQHPSPQLRAGSRGAPFIRKGTSMVRGRVCSAKGSTRYGTNLPSCWLQRMLLV